MKKNGKKKNHISIQQLGYLFFCVVTMQAYWIRPVYAVTVWEKASEIMKDVYKMCIRDRVIEKINEQYMGNFTEGDKVVITTLHQKLKNNKKLVKSAQTDGRQIFEKNIFPQLFDDAAQEAYSESIETYTKLFEDAGKYRAIMGALAHAMFEELQKRNI